RRLLWILLVCVCVAVAVPAEAQDGIAISGTVTTRPDGSIVPGAVVSVVDSDRATTTDATGRYTLVVPASALRNQHFEIRVEALGLPAKTIDVSATDAGTITLDVALTIGFAEQLMVGSRVAGAETQKAVPVDVITREQIAASGFTETTQVIQSLTPSF